MRLRSVQYNAGNLQMTTPGAAAEMRLATYGTLAPGRVNNGQLAALKGVWLKGTVRGHLVEAGWGAALGYPALTLDPSGPAVDVQIFESADLPDHWARIDAFEGPGYRRVITQVKTPEGLLEACIYVIDDSGPHPI